MVGGCELFIGTHAIYTPSKLPKRPIKTIFIKLQKAVKGC